MLNFIVLCINKSSVIVILPVPGPLSIWIIGLDIVNMYADYVAMTTNCQENNTISPIPIYDVATASFICICLLLVPKLLHSIYHTWPSFWQVLLLSKVDQYGNVRPLTSQEHKLAGSKSAAKRKRAKKVETHDKSGQRERYFADDDRFSIQDMVSFTWSL